MVFKQLEPLIDLRLLLRRSIFRIIAICCADNVLPCIQVEVPHIQRTAWILESNQPLALTFKRSILHTTMLRCGGASRSDVVHIRKSAMWTPQTSPVPSPPSEFPHSSWAPSMATRFLSSGLGENFKYASHSFSRRETIHMRRLCECPRVTGVVIFVIF